MGTCNGVNLIIMEPWFGCKLRVEVVSGRKVRGWLLLGNVKLALDVGCDM
jgi:hypothetical protein